MEKYLNKFYDFIDKIGKHNFILIIFIFFVLIVTGLYQTFSLYTESEGLSILNGLDTYSFILDANNKSNSVVIVDGASKNIDITINHSDVPLKYGLYSSKESNSDTNFIFGYSTISKNLPSGVIPAKTDYVITLKVYNYSGDNQTVNFGVQYGFENGVDLTLDSNQYWIEPLHLMKNLFKTWDGDNNYFKIDEYRDSIVTASFVDLDTIDSSVSIENATKAWNISVYGENDESVKAWIVPRSENKYDLYIGSKEKIYAESLYGLFSQMNGLERIDFSNLDTSLVKDMAFLFRECSNLSSIDLSDFDTSNVTNMWSMFGGCKSLTQLDVSSFDTSKVTSMRTMFLECSSLTNLDLSSFNTSNVTNMMQMFGTCSGLISLDLSNFITNNVTKMYNMFEGCSSLTSLNLSNFITNNVTNMSRMFNGCSSLVELDISNFDTHKVTNMESMFYGCSSLISLDISNFDTRKVTNMESMFNGCAKLTGLRITIKNNSGNNPSYACMFAGAATEDDSKILVYYTSDTQTLVNDMVATKSDTSNVYAAIQLAEMPIGRYVRYVGVGVDGNTCDNTTTVNGWTSCSGKNANYESDTSMGYCHDSTYKFGVNGWRIGYINNGSVHLISAGATDCMSTDSDGTPSDTDSSSSLDDLTRHFENLNTMALKYCNSIYAKGGVCDNTTAWAMNAIDFQRIINKPLNATSCYNSANDEECGYNNDLIDNGSYYWYATVYPENTKGAFLWFPNERLVRFYNSSWGLGVRPVLALDSSVAVIGGAGTYSNPYIITN